MRLRTLRSLLCIFLSIYLVQSPVLANGQGAKPAGEKKSSFSDNKQWEQRLLEKQRSVNEIRVKSPLLGTNYQGDQLTFEWENSRSEKMFLGLMSNENKEILYKEVSGNKNVIETKDLGLKPGLYYWVLESEDDILAVGKFYYKRK